MKNIDYKTIKSMLSNYDKLNSENKYLINGIIVSLLYQQNSKKEESN